MRLKEREKSKFPYYLKKYSRAFFKKVFNKRVRIILMVIFILGLLFGGFIIGLLFAGFFGTLDNPSQRAVDFLHFIGIFGLKGYKRQIEALMAENIKIPFNYLAGQFSNPKKIYIDIAFDNYQKLAYKREQAIEQEVLFSSGADYVPARIRYKDQEISARLRLKGDSADHWGGDKWSFRIKVTGGDTLFGMKIFSIQQPKTRENLGGYLYYKALGKIGLFSLRYDFVEVYVNGENKGIFALEEHFEKELIENNNRREGVIIKFNEDNKWQEIYRLMQQFPDEMDVLTHIESEQGDTKWFFESNIESFNDDKFLADPVLSKQLIEARNLLELFRKGELKTHEVFDMDKTAKYYALNTLLGCAHGSFWSNIRFYYNPVNSRLEPIGYDASCGSETSHVLEKYYLPKCLTYTEECYQEMKLFNDLVFRNRVFFEKYMQELEKISNKEFLDKLLEDLEPDFKKYKRIIHKDYPFYHFSTEEFYRNLKQTQDFLDPAKSMNIHFEQSDGNKIVLSIGNMRATPLEIVNVVYNDSVVFENLGNNIVHPTKSFSKKIKYNEFEFKIPGDFVWDDNMVLNLKLNYKLLGLENIKSEDIFPYEYVEEEFLETDFLRQKSNLEEFEFLNIDQTTKSIFIEKGMWKLDESLIIPQGFEVICNEGTTIDLVNEAVIVSYSNLQFTGTGASPIEIISSDKTGQGITVLNAEKASNLKHVVFSDLTNPSKENWELMGAVNFYESEVYLDNVKFENINSEDGLNIIDSKFEIKNSEFENCFSDCFDGDFVNGIVESSLFNNCGNDGVDFSGSEVNLKDLEILNSGDKAISIGEKSNATIENIEINNDDKAYIGIASKDNSNVIVENSKISNVKYGIALYMKKPEFGPSSLQAINVAISNFEEKYFVEKKSNLLVNDAIIPGNQEDAYKMLYGDS